MTGTDFGMGPDFERTPTEKIAAWLADLIDAEHVSAEPLAQLVIACDRAWAAIEFLLTQFGDLSGRELARMEDVIDILCTFSTNLREAIPALPASEVDATRERNRRGDLREDGR